MPDFGPYQVSWSSRSLAALKVIQGLKTASGRAGELKRLLQQIQDRLTQDPLALGEVYRARGNVAEHLAVVDFLAIDFAVDRRRHAVLVRTCRRLGQP